jgi:zinc protease
LQRQLNPYPPDDVRYVPTLEESIARLDAVMRDQVEKLYRDQVGAQAGELAVVGDFDPAATLQQVEGIVKGWTVLVAYRRIERPAQAGVAGARVEIPTPDKASATYLAGHTMPLTDGDADYAALELANFLFGGGDMSSRLGERVREKEGLSYGVMSHFTADARDKAAQFMMYAICNPANMDKVDKAVAEELDKLLKVGTDSAEVAQARKAYLEQRKTGRGRDGHLTALLAERLSEGRTLAFDAELEKRIAELTPEVVAAAFRRHIEPKKLVVIRAGDFKKSSEPKR